MDRRARRTPRQPPPPDEFGIVLALLCAVYLTYTLTPATWAHWIVGVVYLGALFFAVRTSRPGPRMQRLVRIVLVAGAAVSVTALVVLPHDAAIGVLDAVSCVLLGTTLATVLGRVLSHREVTGSTIAGAVSAYLIIGLLFTNIYGVLDWVLPGPFFAGGQPADQQSLQYFSFTTLTTVGYGDYTAASFPGRGVATFEALVAQVFLATLVARLVAAYRRRYPTPPPDPVPPSPLAAPRPLPPNCHFGGFWRT